MMLRPHTACTVTPTRGYDVYGQPALGVPYATQCAIVKIQSRHDKPAVRADSSASRGYADEATVDARLLFTPETPVQKGDRLELLGMSLRVIEVMPRINLFGKLDHNQVDAVAWV